MDELNDYMVGIFSQCIDVSSHHNVHFKYLTILFIDLHLNKAEKTNISWVPIMCPSLNLVIEIQKWKTWFLSYYTTQWDGQA